MNGFTCITISFIWTIFYHIIKNNNNNKKKTFKIDQLIPIHLFQNEYIFNSMIKLNLRKFNQTLKNLNKL